MKQYDRVYYHLMRDAGRLGGLPLWLVFRALPALLGTALVLLVLSAVPARALAQEGGGDLTLASLASGASDGAWEVCGELRVMGYNSPMVPLSQNYWELEVPVRIEVEGGRFIAPVQRP